MTSTLPVTVVTPDLVSPPPGNPSPSVVPAQAPPRRPRSMLIDVVRGIAICLVVIGHTNEGLLHRSWWGSSNIGTWLDNSLYTFHMPTFFFVSGIFVLAGIEKRGTAAYALEKLRTVYWPYVPWAWLTFFTGLFLGRFKTSAMPFHPFLMGFLTGNISWFLPTLFITLMVVTLLRRLPIFLLFALALLAQLMVPLVGAAEVDLVIRYLPFLVLGMWVARHVERLSAVPPWLGVVIALVLATAIVALNRQNHFSDRLRILPVGIMGIVMLLLLANGLGNGAVARFFAWAGEVSFGIFLLSAYLQGIGRQILLSGLHTSEPWIQLLFPSLLAILIPGVIYQRRERLHIGWLFVWPVRKKTAQPVLRTASI